jgi:hypothetical protein
MGGSSSDYCYSITGAEAGSYVAAGTSSSSEGNVTVNRGDYDYWIVKLGASTQKNNTANMQSNNTVVNPKTDIIIKVAPNPVTSFIRIQSNAAVKNAVVRISNLNGKVFHAQSLDLSSSGFVDLPANKLPGGTYVVEITTTDLKRVLRSLNNSRN